MAKGHHTREISTLQNRKQERFLTVQRYPEVKSQIPWIRLRGEWLRQAGFAPQSRIRVRIMNDCLVITRE